MAEGHDRTERATPRRREEARKRGQVVLAPELGPAAVLLAATTLAAVMAPRVLTWASNMMATWLRAAGPLAAEDASPGPLLVTTIRDTASVVGGFILALGAVGTTVALAQVGPRWNPSLLAPKGERIGLAAGAKRVFSVHSVAALVRALGTVVVVGAVGWHAITAVGGAWVLTPAMAPAEVLAVGSAGLRRVLMTLAAALAMIGVADWAWRRRRHEQSLRMTRREVRDEARQQEGDPQVRLRFRRARRDLGRRRMLLDVPTADLVVTNPIHYAVALRWDAHAMRAPRVVAKGAGELAARIRETARGAGVPILERRTLARALYRGVDVGGEIPEALYRAVAELLAWVYAVRRSTAVATVGEGH